MGLKLDTKSGDTHLTPDELDKLIPQHITTRRELDELEQNNIEDAVEWILRTRILNAEKIFSREFQNSLHKKMFNKVWRWAGTIRSLETNLGVRPFEIEIQSNMLNDDAQFWFKNKTFSPLELALRFHHRLVFIHCYPNGNGRHARLMADIILEKLFQLNPISWKGENYIDENIEREFYIKALKQADLGDVSWLFNCIK